MATWRVYLGRHRGDMKAASEAYRRDRAASRRDDRAVAHGAAAAYGSALLLPTVAGVGGVHATRSAVEEYVVKHYLRDESLRGVVVKWLRAAERRVVQWTVRAGALAALKPVLVRFAAVPTIAAVMVAVMLRLGVVKLRDVVAGARAAGSALAAVSRRADRAILELAQWIADEEEAPAVRR